MPTSWAIMSTKVIHKKAKHLEFFRISQSFLSYELINYGLFPNQSGSYIDHSWPNDIIASSSGWLVSRDRCREVSYMRGRCLYFGSSFFAFVTTFDIVNLCFFLFSNEIFLLSRVSNLTQPDGLFNPLSYENQVSEMLCRASNQIFKVRGLKSVGK